MIVRTQTADTTRWAFALALMCSMLGSLLAADPSSAQSTDFRRASGDSTLKRIIAPQTRAIYDRAGTWVFMLTRENVLGIEHASATEIRGAHAEGGFHRVVATVWTTRGKYAVEYYLDEDSPIYVYEAFEYFEDAAPGDSWRNFKGRPGWERRSYIRRGTVGYVEVTGDASFSGTAASYIGSANRLLAALAGRLRESK